LILSKVVSFLYFSKLSSFFYCVQRFVYEALGV